ncbi:hypothetical protein GY26_04745 [Gammaproteobacteria bacterium MFB021]|nr:hypothetical protein GY26_04745 [Gammaproteobacteria bacterium MFB021]
MKLIKQGQFRITKLAGKAAAVSTATLLPLVAFASDSGGGDAGSSAASTITAGAATVGAVMAAVLGVLAAIKVGKLIRRAL